MECLRLVLCRFNGRADFPSAGNTPRRVADVAFLDHLNTLIAGDE